MASSTPLSRRSLLRAAGLAGASGAAVPILSSCGGSPSEDGGSGSFTVYWNAGHAYEAYEAVIAEFEEAHDVSVNFQKFQWPDLRTRLISDFEAGAAPDVVEFNGGDEFAVAGETLPLTQFVDADGAEIGYPDDWQPTTLERNKINGEFWAVQLHLTCTMLVYNRQMLADANVEVPTTWEEMIDAATQLTNGDVYGLNLNQDHSYSWPWMLQNGVRYFDPDTQEFFPDRDLAIEALQFQSDLVHRYQVSPVPVPGTDYSGPQKALSAERAAMILTGPWDLEPITTSSPDLDFGIAPALSNVEQATIQAGSRVFIPAKAKDPELSWDFIKRITSLEVELAATAEAQMLMPRKTWAQSPEVQNNEAFRAFSDGFAYAQDYTEDLAPTGKSGEIGELYKVLYQSVVMEERPPADAMEDFLSAANEAMGR